MGLPECPHDEVVVEPVVNDERTPESRVGAVIARHEAIADTTNLMAGWAAASCLAVTAVVFVFFVISVTFMDKEVGLKKK
jgi:hypothetical protein